MTTPRALQASHGPRDASHEAYSERDNSETSRGGKNDTAVIIDVEKTGIKQACRTVEALLEQITLNDSPPVNEEAVVGPSPTSLRSSKDYLGFKSRRGRRSPAPSSTTRTNQSRKRYSRQRHATPQTTEASEEHNSQLSPTASSVSELSSVLSSNWEGSALPPLSSTTRRMQHHHSLGTNTASLWLDLYHSSEKRAERRLGHVAFATLCAQTLDSVEQATGATPNKTSPLRNPLLASTERVQDTITARKGITISESSSTESGVRMPPRQRKDPSPSNGSISNPSKQRWTVRRKKKSDEHAFGELSNSNVAKHPLMRGNGKDVDAPNLSRLSVQVEEVFTPQMQPPTPARRDSEIVPVLTQIQSDDSQDAVYTPNDYPEMELQRQEKYGDDDYDQNTPAMYASSSSDEMEGIMEESEDDIAAEHNSLPHRSVANGQPQHASSLFQSSPQRLQMFGSEYARFLSPSALGPQVTRSRHRRKASSSRRRSGSVNRIPGRRSVVMEDAGNATLTGAITDILVTHGAEIPPKGFYRLSRTGVGDDVSGLHRGDVGSGRSDTQVYINVKKEANWDRAAQRPCVTALAVIFPDRQEFVPPGFCVVRRYTQSKEGNDTTAKDSSSSMAANLNFGSSGERVFLCYRRSREGNPITGIISLQPSKNETVPEGYTVIERTPREHVADLNSGAGLPMFLGFRQRLANLETLRPLPLVLSAYYSNPFGSAEDSGPLMDQSSRNWRRKRLRAYYCTGGTVVSSDVGQFHIMDRSTHSMLSPSSIANRLEMIEASRQRAAMDDQRRKSSVTTYASSSELYATDLGDTTSTLNDSIASNSSSGHPFSGSRLSLSMDSDNVPESEDSHDQSLNHSFSTSSHNSARGDDGSQGSTRDRSTSSRRVSLKLRNVQTLFTSRDKELQECLATLNFIPVVEHAQAGEGPVLFQSRVAALTPLLTACYTHHGGSSNIAVEGLTKLLTETEFFVADVPVDDNLDNVSWRLTLLDLAVQAVCDVAMSTCRETSFVGCIEFVENAIRFSRGYLSTRTIGYVMRFYLFVFYFGASVPTASKGRNLVWTVDYKEQEDPQGARSVVARDDVPLLHEPAQRLSAVGARLYLTGGAPQAAALALKDLLILAIRRLGSMNMHHLSSCDGTLQSADSDGTQASHFGGFIQGIVSGLIDDTVHRVNMANFTQLALHQIHRSGGSELFWHDMITSCGGGLFGGLLKTREEWKNTYILAFGLLSNLVKVSCGNIRYVPQSLDLIPRDISSKLLNLELLDHFLARFDAETCNFIGAGQQLEAVETMVFSVRRLVAPCLLSNTLAGLEDDRVFRRIIQIVSKLWRSSIFRRRMRVELGILMSHFAIDLLELGPQLRLPCQTGELESGSVGTEVMASPLRGVQSPLLSQQIDILFMTSRWFSADSSDLVQLFLNFDAADNGSDQLLPASLVNLTDRLCGAVCTIAEQAGDVICEQIRSSQMSNTVPPPSPSTASPSLLLPSHPSTPSFLPKRGASETMYLREGARHLQTEAYNAVTQMIKSLACSAALSAGIPFRSGQGSSSDSIRPDIGDSVSVPIPTVHWADAENENPKGRDRTSPDPFHTGKTENETIHDYWHSAAVRHRTSKPPRSKKRDSDIPYVSRGTTDTNLSERRPCSSPYDENTLSTAFEISETKNMRKAIDYLIACNFLTPSPRDIAAFLRAHRGRIKPKVLGVYLGEGGTDGADAEHWNAIRFNFVRLTSFVGMNVEQGLRHFLTNCGFRLPGEAQMIDRLISTFSQCFWEDNAGDRNRCPFSDQDTVYIVSFAVIMLNTDLHKTHTTDATGRRHRKRMTKMEFMNNLRGVEDTEELSHNYLSIIYDRIESHPIELFDDKDSPSHRGEMASLKTMLKRAKASEELLRGMSTHEHHFLAIDDHERSASCKAGEFGFLQDLCRVAFAAIWHHVHGLVHSALDAAHADPRGMVASLELLKNALYVSICLNMTMERTAFMVQLARFKTFSERHGDWRVSHEHQGYKLEEWYEKITHACDEAEEESKLLALVQVNVIIRELHSSFAVDVEAKKEMSRVVRKIRDGEFLLNDPTRSFVREGSLLKRGSRLGRTSNCHFVLFSDVLIYTKETAQSTNEFKIHEELPLHLMKLTDWFPDKKHYSDRAFQIHHPRKTFVVVAASLEERQRWVKDIRGAITEEIHRLADLERARVASASQKR